METHEQHTKGEERRSFLKKLGLAVGALAGGGLVMDLAKRASARTSKIMTPDGRLLEVATDTLQHSSIHDLTPSQIREGIPGRKFVMVIDLAKCKNARKCMLSCQKNHFLQPGQEFMPIYLMQESDKAAPYWMPKPCFHCDNPPCVKVCPVDATFKRQDGIVLVDNERCIGCKFCMVGCPYSARIFNWSEPKLPLDVAQRKYSPETSVPAQEGTVSKCDFCPDRAREGKLPYCAEACPMGTIYFGDANEDAVTNGTETIRLTDLLRDRAGYRHLEHLGTEPRVYYLPPVNRQFPVERGYDNQPEEVKQRYDNTPYGKKRRSEEVTTEDTK